MTIVKHHRSRLLLPGRQPLVPHRSAHAPVTTLIIARAPCFHSLCTSLLLTTTPIWRATPHDATRPWKFRQPHGRPLIMALPYQMTAVSQSQQTIHGSLRSRLTNKPPTFLSSSEKRTTTAPTYQQWAWSPSFLTTRWRRNLELWTKTILMSRRWLLPTVAAPALLQHTTRI